HSSIKASPFELVHGRHARTPLCVSDQDLNLPPLYRNVDTPQRLFAKELSKKLELAFKTVYDNVKDFEENQNMQVFQEGDKVMLFNMALSSKNKPRKLAFDWLGPFIIEKKLSTTRFNVKDLSSDKLLENTHVSLIKPYFESDLLLV
ncbi:hypothetical protein K501DRAFT_190599, partial [Backusella circina FSU 941]